MIAEDVFPLPGFLSHVDWLFTGVENLDHVALAVSGGPDSIALACLMAEYAKRRPGLRLTALTVDHGLRAASRAEAEQVQRWLADPAINMPHVTLVWRDPKPASNIQAQARAARYDLMRDWCMAQGAQVLMTGHHLDDQAETVLMRLGRGSGVDGLAAIEAKRRWNGLWLLRPLLPWPKQALKEILTVRGQAWIEDPSNLDREYARTRTREAMALLLPEGVTAQRIADTARRMARARDALEHYARERLSLVERQGDEIAFDPERLLAPPDETALRALRLLLREVGGGLYLPPEEETMALCQALREPDFAGRTLAGCQFKRDKNIIRIMREKGRKS